jgi:hypothetical protein
MKFNKWTLGLAAVGAVSIASAVRADEAPKMSQLQTALSNTTISGYVDVAAQYNPGNYSSVPTINGNGSTQYPRGISGYPAGEGMNSLSGVTKADSFTLNDVDIAIDKPEDDTPWASGYHLDLNWGADAINGVAGVGSTVLGAAGGGGANAQNAVQSVQNFGIRQAYVVIRTPVGNGIDWKVGVQDDIIGYEGNTDGANPNYTRSIGYSLEPTTLTGIVGTYQICKAVTVQGGIADATSGNNSLSSKTYVGSVALTAPDSWGWLKGSTLNAGTVLNLENFGQCNYYVGTTLATPWSALKVGGSFDLASVADGQTGAGPNNDSGWDFALYANVQATDKLSFNARGEFYDLQAGVNPYAYGTPNFWNNGTGEEVTLTAQYNLWANVISRVEFRWDHIDSGRAFGGSTDLGLGGTGPAYGDAFLIAANLIYQF